MTYSSQLLEMRKVEQILDWSQLIFRKEKTMTRVTSAANDEILVVSADSLLTNNITNNKTYKKKILHNKKIIIALLGQIELITSNGIIEFDKVIENIIKQEINPYLVENQIIQTVEKYFSKYYNKNFLQVCLFWRENQHFLLRAFQLNGDYKIMPFLNYAFGYDYKTKDNVIKVINHYYFDTGEGAGNHLLGFLNTNPLDFSIQTVRNAINNTDFQTVGGDVFTVTLDKHGIIETYVNGRKNSFNSSQLLEMIK